jgi:nicotinamidase/pyrazinamidase
MAKRIELLIIDPQNDFCTERVTSKNHLTGHEIESMGALFVPGADHDMSRLAKFIERAGDKLFDIHVTLDSHRLVDISHPIFWVDKDSNPPEPFTIISYDEVKQGIWRAKNPGYQAKANSYVKSLEDNKRYPLCIWPPHCLIGTWGHNVVPELFDAMLAWEARNFANVDFVTKGSNPFTEHYSGVQADVPDPTDPSTQLNTGLINTLQDADIIILSGEARSHCLANTVLDIAAKFDADGNAEYIKKMVLLTDATSDVPDPPGTTMFSDFGKQFVSDMCAKGMQLSTTEEFLS